MNLIKKVRKTGFTIAPEAGSQRLRDVINKNISQDNIVETVRDAFGLGWQVIKLYFMIGLPTETDEDLEAIAYTECEFAVGDELFEGVAEVVDDLVGEDLSGCDVVAVAEASGDD